MEDQICSLMYLLRFLPLISYLPTKRQRQHFMYVPDETVEVANVENENFILVFTDWTWVIWIEMVIHLFVCKWLYLEGAW